MTDVTVSPTAGRQFDRLPLMIQQRVLAVLERLRHWPAVSGAKPLRSALAGRWRIRTGDYRVQFFIDGNRLVVEKIGHRDHFYEDRR